MLLNPDLTLAYIVVATALAVAPGPDVLFVVANGMRHHVKGAVAAALGVGAGSIMHALAAALGVSAVIAASPLAFEVLRYAGAAYLLYLGIRALLACWRNVQPAGRVPEASRTSGWKLFQRGMITNVLNPKMVVFYLALLPQFVDPSLGHVGLQMFALGCLHNAIGTVFLLGVGMAAGKAALWTSRTSFGRWMDGISGIFFIGLALRVAVSGRPQT